MPTNPSPPPRLQAIPTEELLRRARGETPDMSSHLARPDLWKRPPGGPGFYVRSQNIFAVINAAAGRYVQLVALCKLWEEEGLMGSELGSPGAYTVAVLEALAVGLEDARQAGDEASIRTLSRALRAMLAWDALVAVPGRRASVVGVLAGEPDFRGVPDPPNHQGLVCATSGMRWQHNRAKRQWHKQEQHGELLAGALRLGPVKPILKALANRRGSITSAVGLSEGEADLMRQAVLERHVDSARVMATWLLPYGVLHTEGRAEWAWELRRTSLGADSLFCSTQPNGNKPPHPYGWFREDTGEWGTLRPAYPRPSKVNAGFKVEVRDGIVTARVDPECGEEVHVPRLGGEPLWVVRVEGGKVQFRGEP